MSQLLAKFAPQLVPYSAVGQNNGVAGLDGTGKISTSVIPAGALGGLTFRGTFDASTGAYPTTPNNGDMYIVSTAGTVSGTALKMGEFIFWSSSQSAWEVIQSPVNSDSVSEGTTNLYWTLARTQQVVKNTLSNGEINYAPSVASVVSALSGKVNSYTAVQQSFTLTTGDITNQYVIFSNLALPNQTRVVVVGCTPVVEGVDYTLSTDGSSGNTKLTFAGSLASNGATPLSSGDQIWVQYLHA